MADVASVSLVQGQALTRGSAVNEELQKALTSRFMIEQAKGLLAQIGGLDMVQAFAALQQFARDNNRWLSDVARDLVTRELSGRDLLDHVDIPRVQAE